MLKRIDLIASWALAALGGVHCALTGVFYPSMSDAALWFFAAGLSLVFAGLLNVQRVANPSLTGLLRSAQLANAALLLFALVYAGRDAMKALTDPPSILLLVLVSAVTLLSFIRR